MSDPQINIHTKGQHRHAVLPDATAEENSRQEFVRGLKYHLARKVAPGNRIAYESRALPAFRSESGRDPKDHNEVRKIMSDEPFFSFWSALQRNSQEMMWRAVQIPVENQAEKLRAAASEQQQAAKLGSLKLNPDLEIPRYHRKVDIHCMPGGYHTEFAADDVSNGAVYDRAVWLYAMGRMGPLNDDMGNSLIAYLKSEYPAHSPKRILDLGCTVGHSTLPYVDAYPDAEVHAIDVAAPMLRYAHARAESLGKPVHFAQMNAEATDFPDQYFDLIVSHIFVHETSHVAIRRVMRECHRLLRPGGVVLHAETPPYKAMPTPFDAFILDWDTRNNNEPFWQASHEIEPAELAESAGFGADCAIEATVPSAFEAAQAQRTGTFQGGDFGGGGAWYLWGAVKRA